MYGLMIECIWQEARVFIAGRYSVYGWRLELI